MAYHSALIAIFFKFVCLSVVAYGTENATLSFQKNNDTKVHNTSMKGTTESLNFNSPLYRTSTTESLMRTKVKDISISFPVTSSSSFQTSTSNSNTKVTSKPSVSTRPPKQKIISNFSASWHTENYVVINWDEENNITSNVTQWELEFTNPFQNLSLFIPYNCSLTFGSNQHAVTLQSSSCIRSSVNESLNETPLNVEPCFLYSIRIIPVLLQGNAQEENTELKLSPFLKLPSHLTSHYKKEENELEISWKRPRFKKNCNLTYHYELKIDGENPTILGNTTDGAITYVPTKCVNYSISVRTKINNVVQSHQPGNHSGRITYLQGLGNIADLNPSVTIINSTCGIIRWSLSSSISELITCVREIQIEILSSLGSKVIIERVNKSTRDEKFCYFQPGESYVVKAYIVDNNGEIVEPSGHPSWASFTTPNAYEATTVGLIAVSCLFLLTIAIIGICIYFRKYPKSHRNSLRQEMSFFSRNRKRCHPIKIRDLDAVIQRLCHNAGHLLELEFEDLKVIADARRSRDCYVALRPENLEKNRYFDVLPYDSTRVPLTPLPNNPHSDYINASYIMGFNGSKEYIATQGPKANTISDFWRMVWEHQVFVIVMVTSLEERGKSKCDRYWPEDKENSLTYDDLSIKMTEESDFTNYMIRTLYLTNGEESRVIKQTYLKGWPDFGVPDCPEILVHFIEVIRMLINEKQSHQSSGPIVVHCSAGVGRTGTYIAVDWLMQEARERKEVDVFSTVLRMRECRVQMVQSEEQYEYIYKCLNHYASTRLFSTRENDENVPELLLA